MAMFGSKRAAAAADYDPSKLSRADKLALFGSTLQDVGNSLGGRQAGAVDDTIASLAARQQQARSLAFRQQLEGMLGPQYQDGPAVAIGAPGRSTPGLFGGQAAAAAEAPAPAAYQPPQRTSSGLAIDSPELPKLLLQAQEAGVPMDAIVKVLTANQPDMQQDTAGGFYNKHNAGLSGTRTANRANVGNTIVDLNDATNTNRVISEAPEKGAMPVYDNLGHVIDWSLPRGVTEAMQTAAQARQTGQTFGTVYNRPDGEGHTSPTLGSDMFGGGQGGTGGGPGPGVGPGRTQSPAEAEAAKIQAGAAAQAKVDLPRLKQSSDQAIGLIDRMLTHPSLKARTGMSGLLPAFPGTRDAGFDAMAKQIHGKTFLEAFQSLKGAGQITEIEGAKATDAIARLDRAQSAEDYSSALKDLRDVVTTGMERARTQAAPAMPQTSSGGPRTQGFRSRIVEVH